MMNTSIRIPYENKLFHKMWVPAPLSSVPPGTYLTSLFAQRKKPVVEFPSVKWHPVASAGQGGFFFPRDSTDPLVRGRIHKAWLSHAIVSSNWVT